MGLAGVARSTPRLTLLFPSWPGDMMKYVNEVLEADVGR